MACSSWFSVILATVELRGMARSVISVSWDTMLRVVTMPVTVRTASARISGETATVTLVRKRTSSPSCSAQCVWNWSLRELQERREGRSRCPRPSIFDHAHQIRDGAVRFNWMAQVLGSVNRISVSSPDLVDLKVSGICQFRDDPLYGALGDPDLRRDIPDALLRKLSEQEQYMRVIRQERPGDSSALRYSHSAWPL
jgi:hypothetical protein